MTAIEIIEALETLQEAVDNVIVELHKGASLDDVSPSLREIQKGLEILLGNDR